MGLKAQWCPRVHNPTATRVLLCVLVVSFLGTCVRGQDLAVRVPYIFGQFDEFPSYLFSNGYLLFYTAPAPDGVSKGLSSLDPAKTSISYLGTATSPLSAVSLSYMAKHKNNVYLGSDSLWSWNGTTFSGPLSASLTSVSSLCDAGAFLYFAGDDFGGLGIQLFRYSTVTKAVTLAASPEVSGTSASPQWVTRFSDGRVFFVAFSGAHLGIFVLICMGWCRLCTGFWVSAVSRWFVCRPLRSTLHSHDCTHCSRRVRPCSLVLRLFPVFIG